jgi:hypothetical protein
VNWPDDERVAGREWIALRPGCAAPEGAAVQPL